MLRLQSGPYLHVWAFAAPQPAAYSASLAGPGLTFRGEPVRPGKAPLALYLFQPYPCTLDRGRPWPLSVLKNVSLTTQAQNRKTILFTVP